jgi:microcystin-dependent protein
LEANGAAVSRSTYSTYFSLVSTLYGVGNGSTTFNIPDYRGTFLRGWDHAAGNDPDAASRTNSGGGTTGDNVGTKQTSQYASHTHGPGTYTTTGTGKCVNCSGTNPNFSTSGGTTGGTNTADSATFTVTGTVNGGVSTASGGNETRPRNINVLFCVFVGA